jgi:peptidyl-prolyl cis-trans isomerase D
MRENTKIILWIVVVAFVVTIFAVWGMDLQTGSSSVDPTILGRVNGIPITRSQYQLVYEQLAAQMRATTQDNQLNYSQQALVSTQAWENIVYGILTDHEIRKMGISVTDEEILGYLRNTPPPEIQQYFIDDQGNFDNQAYQTALSNPEIDWTSLERLARQRIPRLKLNRYLTTQVHVSGEEIRRAYQLESTELTLEYVEFQIASEELGDYEPGDAEMTQYYNEHLDEFKMPERARLEVVRLEIKPTTTDWDDAAYTAGLVRDRILAGEVFGDAARGDSDAPTAGVNGETGFIARDQRVDAYFETLDALAPGDISEAVRTESGVYLLKLLEKRTGESGSDEYNAQEILIAATASRETVDSLYALAADIQERAQAAGLETAADEYQLTLQRTEPFFRNSPMGGLGFVPTVNNFAFTQEVGTVSEVLRDDENLYVARVVERLAEGVQPLTEVQAIVRSRVIFEKRKLLGQNKAAAFRLNAKNSDMASAARASGATLNRPDPFQGSEGAAGVGVGTAIAEIALSLDPGMIGPPVEAGGAYVVVRLIDKSAFNEEEYRQRAGAIRDRLRQQKLQQYVAYWYESLKEGSKIEDYRAGI